MSDDLLSLVTGGKQSFTPTTASATPADYSGLISSAEQQHGLPQGLLSRLIQHGENSGATAVSKKGAVGLGQLMPGTAKDLGVTDPTDPAQNIDGSARYLKQMLDRYNGDQTLAVAAYNAGPGAVDEHGGVPPYPETQKYVARVLGQPQAQQDGGQSSGGGDILSLVTGGKQSLSAPAAPQQPAANAPRASNEIYNPKDNSQYTPEQVKTIQQMIAAGKFDTAQGAYLTHGGEANTPYMAASDDDVPTTPGTYYVDRKGVIQQTPGKPVSAGEGLGAGAVQGVGDVGASVAQGKEALTKALLAPRAVDLPGSKLLGIGLELPELAVKSLGMKNTGDMVNNALVQRNVYDARYGGNGYALAGRVGGNIAASAPLLATGEGAISEMGPIGSFLMGQGGRGAGAANLLLRGTSLASRGAAEGAAASGLTSSSNSNDPVLYQIAEGANLGASLGLAGPLLHGAGRGLVDAAIDLTKPLTASGRNALIMDHLADLAKGGSTDIQAASPIPGVQRTLAQSIPGGNAGLGALERSMRGSDPAFNNSLTETAGANTEARKGYLSSLIPSAEDVQAAKTAAEAAHAGRIDKTLSTATPTNAPAVVQNIDDALTSPAAAQPSVRNALQAARQALVSEESGLSDTQRAGFHRSLMNAMGSDAAAPTQDAMQANKDRLGAIFNGVAAKTDIKAGDHLLGALGNVVNGAQQVLPDSEVQPLLKQVQNIADTMKPDGTISGESYQALTRKGAPLDRLSAAGGNPGYYAGQIRDVLDDALERSAAPDDLAALKQARNQYRNMKMVEAAAGKVTPGGTIEPSAVLASVRKSTPNYAYTGGGDVGNAAETAIKQGQTRAVYDARPETLHEVYNLLSTAASKPGAHDAINDARTAVLNEMERAAPGYTKNLAQSAMERHAIAQQDYLRSLGLTLNNEAPTLNKLNGALKKIKNDPSAPVSASMVDRLTTLRDDLAMDNGSNAGRGTGSDTHQKFATSALTNAVGKAKGVSNLIGLLGAGGEMAASHNPLFSGVAGLASAKAADVIGGVYTQKNALIQEALRNALLNPETVTLKTKVPTGSFLGKHPVVNSLLKSNAIPALVDTKNRLLGAQ